MSFDARRLFHAVVVSGAALAGCGRQAAPAPVIGSSAPPAGAPVDAPTGIATVDADGKECPPGSEMPMPPCYYIL